MRRLWIVALLVACGGNVEPTSGAPRSCLNRTSGADASCGAGRNTDCCASVLVEGGTYNRLNDARYAATVTSFRMDIFQVTNGRFRAFLDALPSSRPKVGDGAHPKVPGSGWQAAWDKFLRTRKEIELGMAAGGADGKVLTWTGVPGANEYIPVGGLSWYEAFAFCAWDGGRLPTDAEWNYVAVGGSEQRKYPWGSEPPDPTRATLTFTPAFKETGHLTPVGSAPKGASRWGVFDMAGSRREFVRDGSATTTPDIGIPVPCTDCFRRDNTENGQWIQRNFHWVAGPEYANVGERLMLTYEEPGRSVADGVRCVRDVR